MSLKKNLAYNFLLSLSQVLFPLITIPFVSRVLEPVGLGRVNMTDGLVYYFISFAEFGIATYAIREVARRRDRPDALRALVSELLSLHLLTSVVALLAFLVTAWGLYERVDDWRLVVFGATFVLVNALACEWYFYGTGQFRYIAVRNLLVRLVAVVALFGLLRGPADYVLYYAIVVASAIAVLLLNFARMLRETGFRFTRANWAAHLSVTRVTWMISLAYSVPLMLDNVLLGLLAGIGTVAFYALAVKVVQLISALITDLFVVLYPHTVSIVQEADAVRVKQNLQYSFELLLLMAVPAGVGLWLVADAFTLFYFGPRFAGVSAPLRILCAYPLLKAGSLFLNKQVLMPYDDERLVLRGLLVGALVFLLSTILFVPSLKAVGMAWALVVSEAFVLACNLYYTRRRYPGLRFWNGRSLYASLLCGALFLFIGLSARQLNWSPSAYVALTFTLCFGTWVAVMAALRLDVYRLFMEGLRRKFLQHES